MKTLHEAAPEPEPVACLIRHRCGTPSRVSHDGRTHWHEWGEWQIANLAHGKAVTDPARNPTQNGEWQMQPLYAAPPAAPAPAQPVPLTREQQIAMREAYCNTASYEYFRARPYIDDGMERRIYEAGFKEGWERCLTGGSE